MPVDNESAFRVSHDPTCATTEGRGAECDCSAGLLAAMGVTHHPRADQGRPLTPANREQMLGRLQRGLASLRERPRLETRFRDEETLEHLWLSEAQTEYLLTLALAYNMAPPDAEHLLRAVLEQECQRYGVDARVVDAHPMAAAEEIEDGLPTPKANL